MLNSTLTIRNNTPKATKDTKIAMAGAVPKKISINSAKKLYAISQVTGSKADQKRFNDYMKNAGLTMEDLK